MLVFVAFFFCGRSNLSWYYSFWKRGFHRQPDWNRYHKMIQRMITFIAIFYSMNLYAAVAIIVVIFATISCKCSKSCLPVDKMFGYRYWQITLLFVTVPILILTILALFNNNSRNYSCSIQYD